MSVLEYVKKGSQFYKERLKDISCIKVGTELDQYISQLPYTTKDDLRKARETISSQRLSDAWVYYETTGTTGPATPCPRNEEDSLVNNAFLALQYENIFQKENGSHIVGVMGPTELHSTGDTFEDVFRSLGHTVVKMWPRSPVVGLHRVIRLIKELKITALVCTPAVASEIVKHGIKNGVDVKRLGVEVILVLGELITPNRLRNLGTAWGAKIYNCMYASQETSILAAANQNNELETIPLNNYYELLNPFTDEKLSIGEKSVSGELVVTHLYKGHKPLIRYRTGDMLKSRLSNKSGSWIIEPIGRVKDILTINNQKVYAFDLENLIFEELEHCYEYFVEIDSDGLNDSLSIILEECKELEDKKLLGLIEKKLVEKLDVKVNINVGNVGNLIGTGAMVSWKAARIKDNRENAVNSERKVALDIALKRVEV
nr:AMP-binding protein [Spartinivicinus marinus]